LLSLLTLYFDQHQAVETGDGLSIPSSDELDDALRLKISRSSYSEMKIY